MSMGVKENSPLLRDCFEKLIHIKLKAEKVRTAGNYQSAWNKLSVYLGNRKDDFALSEFTNPFVQNYVLWLLQSKEYGSPLTPGSQDFYLRNLKAMYNKLKKELQINLPESNPFSGLHIKVPPTRKRALPNDEIKKLKDLNLSDPRLLSALHLALFLFYARGMCFVDVFYLQHLNIKSDYIHYKRSKTGVDLQVKITPEMYAIICRYRQKDNPWLFPFLHERLHGLGPIAPQSALRRINRYLQSVGEKLEFHQPLTTYVMRHSWASMMLEADSEISVISQSLGHTSLHTTEIYLGQLSVSKIDKASDNMLDNLVRTPQKRNSPRESIYYPVASKPAEPNLPAVIRKESIGSICKNIFASIAAKVQLILS